MEVIELLKTLGSMAGIAPLITASFDIWTQRVQHGRILEIEELKKSYALESFRYGKLYDHI